MSTRFHVEFDWQGQRLRLVSWTKGREPQVTDQLDGAPSWPKARAEQLRRKINGTLNPRLVPALDVSTRGRFYIIRDHDGWTLVDDKWSGTVTFGRKADAEDAKLFATQYVRRWGDINFFAFPSSIDRAPVRLDLNDVAISSPDDAPTWDAIEDTVTEHHTIREPLWPRRSR